MKVRCSVELGSYNGWENKFTWLVHLHLSNEQSLMNEVIELVAPTSDEVDAGRLVEQWVQTGITGWVNGFPDRNKHDDEYVRLLTWDLAGSALAYADWERLVMLLMGQVTICDNPFTWTLHSSITNVSYFQQSVHLLMQSASSIYACADVLQAWFKEQVDEWVDVPATRRRQYPTMSILVNNLLQNTYGVVCWEHVARAFRPGYWAELNT